MFLIDNKYTSIEDHIRVVFLPPSFYHTSNCDSVTGVLKLLTTLLVYRITSFNASLKIYLKYIQQKQELKEYRHSAVCPHDAQLFKYEQVLRKPTHQQDACSNDSYQTTVCSSVCWPLILGRPLAGQQPAAAADLHQCHCHRMRSISAALRTRLVSVGTGR